MPWIIEGSVAIRHFRMFKKAAQQGRSERNAEAYPLRYVEALSDARTKLEAFFNILLGIAWDFQPETSPQS